MFLKTLAAISITWTGMLFGQSTAATAKPLAFAVVSIRHSTRTDGAWGFPNVQDGFSAMNVPLRKIIEAAYSMNDDDLVLGGPSWVDSANFDLEAKFAPEDVGAAQAMTSDQRSALLQPVLADRFHLVVHHETRPRPVFLLTVLKQGARLNPPSSAAANSRCLFHMPSVHTLSADNCKVENLIQVLRNNTGRIILDRTGLTGVYDFSLHWTPDDTPADSPAAGGPSFFTALQEQLGLKLEPATAPIDVLVIDSAQKPSPN
ncbi:MAG TPA: TIGR03435 family protein [Acidobacteriaceae bacterium]|nr:TIGR03435 family protein [Acidobacteriaceae bacterium]